MYTTPLCCASALYTDCTSALYTFSHTVSTNQRADQEVSTTPEPYHVGSDAVAEVEQVEGVHELGVLQHARVVSVQALEVLRDCKLALDVGEG